MGKKKQKKQPYHFFFFVSVYMLIVVIVAWVQTQAKSQDYLQTFLSFLARGKAQDASYTWGMGASSKYRMLNIWELYKNRG